MVIAIVQFILNYSINLSLVFKNFSEACCISSMSIKQQFNFFLYPQKKKNLFVIKFALNPR